MRQHRVGPRSSPQDRAEKHSENWENCVQRQDKKKKKIQQSNKFDLILDQYGLFL